ncbi:MAG: SDR family NAD(P)-dependent oxidoreductase [Myxococcota bacterium]|nr:SDR family NAD(P)-dependent oxidoreductase [Myxococcota bacterium]
MKKICVVVGVGPGNGAALSRRFAGEGFTVVMLARRADQLAKLAEEIPGTFGLVCDVSDPSEIESVFEQIHHDFGPVSALIYNAGSGQWSDVMNTTVDGFQKAWATNALGLLVCAQQVIPYMVSAGHGQIMVIGATASLRGGANFTAFASAKSAQRSLAQSMARDLGPKGIHVGYFIIDGIIDLERTRDFFQDKPDDFFMQADAIADSVWAVTQQDRSAWTFELDLRPYSERW